jgi:pSer/pThr/pTyr-binding forkhead associated (FHA) protein
MRSGPTPGATFPLEGDQLTVGRDSSNAVAINDGEVSRRHARLSFQGGKYVVEDLGSTNGTFVNGQRLSNPVVLKPGDVVSFGEQIVLLYDAINQDPGATMASARRPVRPAPAPAAAPAASAAGPMPAQPAPAGSAKGGRTALLAIGAVVLVLVCLCVVMFAYADADPTGARWCSFPFSVIAQILGATCP